jgi:hypothetical protein
VIGWRLATKLGVGLAWGFVPGVQLRETQGQQCVLCLLRGFLTGAAEEAAL